MSVIIDVSHIANWEGRLTGIERVEYHIIRHYFEKKDSTFVKWDSALRTFVKVNIQQVQRDILDKPSAKESTKAASKQERATIGRVVNKLRRSVKSARPVYSSSLSDADVLSIQDNGALLVLAGLWDDNDYIAAVKEVAKKRDVIHIVYDMIPIVQPQYVVDFLPPVFEKYMCSVLPLCSGVMAISESTLRDTKKVLASRKLRVPKLHAFRLGDDIDVSGEEQQPQGIEAGYLLSVSTVETRKNHMLLYYLYKRAIEKGINLPTLLIVGRRGWHTEDFQYLIEHDPEVSAKIKILDGMDDKKLRWLYRNCLAVVFPSLYEGWGLPVAEALNYGKVVFSSNVSSMPEIASSSVVEYFSPISCDELLDRIVPYLKKGAIARREALIKKDYKAKKWDDSTAEFDRIVSSWL